MAGHVNALLWRRLDTAGAEHVILSERSGLHARGTMVAATPVPFACRYELYTDDSWATARVEATVEGAGFVRSVRLERAIGRWRVTASEQGDLDAALRSAGMPAAGLPGSADPGRLRAALDVDLGSSPLTNTLPVRRLGLLQAARGTREAVDVAWVLVPSLEVLDASQTYAVPGGDTAAPGAGTLRFSSGSFSADLTFDAEGYVVDYPGLASRA